MTGRRDERGSASVELVGLLPVLLVVILVVLQFGIACWAMVETQQAARGAARAATLGEDPYSAARGSLPGALNASAITGGRSGDSERWTVTVPVPSLLHIPLGSVTRTVEMPEIR